MNRFFRRLVRFRKGATAPRGQEFARGQEQIYDHGTPQDVTSVRAKSARHGKVTADKWNQ